MGQKEGDAPAFSKCFCGKPSKVFDTWFLVFACEDHNHLTPNEYREQAKQSIVTNSTTRKPHGPY